MSRVLRLTGTAGRGGPALAALLAALVALLALAASASAATFTSSGTISIPSSGVASPYPSTILVSGLSSYTTDVNVVLHGFTHSWPDDVEILLVGPGGQNVVLMSDCGGGGAVNGGELAFDDAAGSILQDSATIVSGTYRPTSWFTTGGISIVSPAPSGPYGSALSVFNGVDPNGTWRLYVYDDLGGDAGSISGWSLDITVDDTAPVTTVSCSPSPNAAGWNNSDVTATLSATDAGSGVAGSEFRQSGAATWTAYAPWLISSEGETTWEYRSTDNAGNTETAQILTVKIDRTGPVTSDDAPGGWLTGSPALVTLSADDGAGCGMSGGLARTEYKLDGAAVWSEGTQVTVAGDGAHTITYRSTDALGNVGPEGSCAVQIDASLPSITVAGADAAWHAAPVTLTFTANGGSSGVASVEYKLGSAAWTQLAPAGGAYTLTVSAQGQTSVQYRTTNVAGVQSTVGNCVVKIDSGTPVLRLASRKLRLWAGSDLRLKLRWNDAVAKRARLDVRVTQYGSQKQTLFKVDLGRRGRWQAVALAWRPHTPGRYRLHLVLSDAAGHRCLASALVIAHP